MEHPEFQRSDQHDESVEETDEVCGVWGIGEDREQTSSAGHLLRMREITGSTEYE